MNKNLKILLIEDDAIEVMKFKRVVSSLPEDHKIIEAENGEEALPMLTKHEFLPDVIILDLNMPKINGIEFLKILKNDALLKYIPVTILTTSNNHSDVLKCFEIGIAGYIVKPLKYEDYLDKIQKTVNYWSVNQLVSR